MKLELSDKEVAACASDEDISLAVKLLPQSEDGFLILSEHDDSFMQTATGEPGFFHIEYRCGDQMFESKAPLPAETIERLLLSYRHRDDRWRTECEWAPMEFSPHSAQVGPGEVEDGKRFDHFKDTPLEPEDNNKDGRSVLSGLIIGLVLYVLWRFVFSR